MTKAARIASRVPLSALHPEFRTLEILERCHLCGGTQAPAQLWRECDERDRLTAESPLLIVCGSKECAQTIEKHHRLYRREYPGSPGHFPVLCGPCVHRDGAHCKHPDLKANGGEGLKVVLHDPFKNAIICGRNGMIQHPVQATGCAGRATRSGVVKTIALLLSQLPFVGLKLTPAARLAVYLGARGWVVGRGSA